MCDAVALIGVGVAVLADRQAPFSEAVIGFGLAPALNRAFNLGVEWSTGP